jgi:spore cortex formation protein SpoVR/YcgB (stage V sporulation)
MRAIHIIEDKVVNIIEVESLDSFTPSEGFLHADDPDAQIGGLYLDNKFYPPRPTNEQQDELRRKAYEAEADPLFFLIQRGEATQEEWQAKITEIKERYPYYYDDEGNLLEAQG